jgi:HK97 family phage major capsid protein
LSSKPTITKAEERRNTFLLSKIASLRQGLSPKEIANVEYERLCNETGVISLNTRTMPERDELEWRHFLSHGGQRHFNRPVRFEISEISEEEQRQQLAGSQSITQSTGAAGGFFVPYGFQDRTLAALRAYDEVFDDANCSPCSTLTGAPLAIPAISDVENSSILVGENSNAGTPGATFTATSTQLGAYSFRSQFVFVSLELLTDTSFNVGSILERSFAVRHARGVGQYLINGTGINQPKGLITAGIATGNITVAAGSSANDGTAATGANSIASVDLSLVYGNLNRAYRKESVWIMNDETLLALRSTLDRVGRPLVNFSNDVATIYGRPVAVAPSMSPIGPSAYSVALYAPRFFLQRRVTAGSYVRRSIEVFGGVEKGMIGFSSMYRTDSNMSCPNQNFPPISLLVQHS